MNGKLFLDAMEGIRDEYILSAQARLGYLPAQGKRRALPVRRIFTAALALLCTIAAAMAVSPPFRAAVISLFQLAEAEQVPGIPAGFGSMKKIIEEIIPCHIGIEYVFWYITWAMMEARFDTWGDIEAGDYDWESLEKLVE